MKIIQYENSIEVLDIESREHVDFIFAAIKEASLKFLNTPDKITQRIKKH